MSSAPTARGNGGRRMGHGWIVPVAVVTAIAAFVLLPVRGQLFPGQDPELQPLEVTKLPAAPRIPAAATWPAESSPQIRTLILYDTGARWGWLGEVYAMQTANLVSHFGRWEAKPARQYRSGDVDRYSALIYLGSTYDEPLPRALLDDVLRTRTPVMWVNDNILQLTLRAGDFAKSYGWEPVRWDRSRIAQVRYKGRSLTRWARQDAGIMFSRIADPGRAKELARAIRTDGSGLSWAIRSRNLTYVAEQPFTYMSEADRVLVFADLLFDLLAPTTRERHRALVRLEDIHPRSDPEELRAVADYLHAKGIPFGFSVSPYYRDPQGHEDEPYELLLRDAPEVASALQYLIRRGGVLVGHGYTHQWDGASNPYNGVTGDDVEFYRVTETPDGAVKLHGPLPGDRTVEWSERRIVAANEEFRAAGLPEPRIFEFPHYYASPRAYRAAAHRFPARWERATYFSGVLTGKPLRYDRSDSQFFPYVVRDVYGTKVLPENIGSIAPTPWHSYKARGPDDLVRAARANLAVRDGIAAFYFHPFLDHDLLKRTIEGIEALGYTFVDPASL
jgi:uncharacterized protein YdaL